jgi:hypothetical protein
LIGKRVFDIACLALTLRGIECAVTDCSKAVLVNECVSVDARNTITGIHVIIDTERANFCANGVEPQIKAVGAVETVSIGVEIIALLIEVPPRYAVSINHGISGNASRANSCRHAVGIAKRIDLGAKGF